MLMLQLREVASLARRGDHGECALASVVDDEELASSLELVFLEEPRLVDHGHLLPMIPTHHAGKVSHAHPLAIRRASLWHPTDDVGEVLEARQKSRQLSTHDHNKARHRNAAHTTTWIKRLISKIHAARIELIPQVRHEVAREVHGFLLHDEEATTILFYTTHVCTELRDDRVDDVVDDELDESVALFQELSRMQSSPANMCKAQSQRLAGEICKNRFAKTWQISHLCARSRCMLLGQLPRQNITYGLLRGRCDWVPLPRDPN